MRSAESLIPIKIGSCMLPPPNSPQEKLKAIFSRIDFYHEHQYVEEDTFNPGSYYERLAYADSLLREVFEFRDWFNTYAPPPYSDKDSIEICITEWNLCIFWPYIPTDHPITRVNVSLTSAIFAACRLGDFITYAESLNIGVVNHYRTYWWNHHLSLLSNIPNFTRRPQFYVLKMFTRAFGATLVKNELICDSFEIGSFNIPYINAYTSINFSGDTLYLIVVNKDSSTNYETIVKIDGIILDSIARVFTLNGDSIYATNEEDPKAVIIRDSVITNVSDSFNYIFSLHTQLLQWYLRVKLGLKNNEKFYIHANYIKFILILFSIKRLSVIGYQM